MLFDCLLTNGTLYQSSKTLKTICVPIITGLPRLYQQCTNGVPIVKNSQKTVKTAKMTIGVPIATGLPRLYPVFYPVPQALREGNYDCCGGGRRSSAEGARSSRLATRPRRRRRRGGGEWRGGIPLPSRQGGLGERRELAQRRRGRSPGRKRILCTLELSESRWWQSF